MDEGKIRNKMLPVNKDAASGLEVHIKENVIKEEKISDEEEPAINEEVVFLAGAIKVEYPVDNYEHKSSTDFGSLVPKPELTVADHEQMFPVKEEKMEDNDQTETQQTDDGSTSSDPRPSQCFKPSCSVQEERSKAMKKEHQSNQERRTSKEVHRMLTRPSLQATGVQHLASNVCAERNNEPKLTEITSLSEAHVKSTPDSNGKTFSQKKRPSKLHTGAKPFQWDDCGPRLSRSRSLTGRKPFQCNECGKVFSQNCDLKIHLRTHTGEKPFQCDECGQRFTQSISLRLHLRIHTGEKPFQCEECKRRFRLGNDLKKHLRIHTEEKPFQCDECELRFRLLNDLKKHRRIHAGEKLFQCDKCQKQFSQSSNLNVHKRVHTGEKPFKCSECPQAFSRSHDLKRHRRIHTGEKPFQCEECEHRFSQSNSLKQHQMVHRKKSRPDVPSANICFLEGTFEDTHRREAVSV